MGGILSHKCRGKSVEKHDVVTGLKKTMMQLHTKEKQ
jgi:hypothetical protein